MKILKDEINEAVAALLELAKWKLFVLAPLTAVGLGILEGVHPFPQSYLLLFLAPFVCAYVDLLAYERVAGLRILAKYLRMTTPDDAEGKHIHDYEVFVQECRDANVALPHETNARFASSLVSSIAIPLLALALTPKPSIAPQLWALHVVGVVFVVWTYFRVHNQLKTIDGYKPTKPA